MGNFMRDGGVGMWFTLVLGLATLIGAALFARRPDELRLAALRAGSLATLFASLTAFIGGVAATFKYIHRIPAERKADWPHFVMLGLAEASANLVLGFALLTITWLVIAVGLRRLAAKERAGV